ncbi:MAG TPA: nuclear transport factor 2 family protein [Streptosporangiaceae bacterium]|jgi:ketosteroid isomerase-like protein
MDDTAEFLAALMPRLTEAETALHGGDPAQRIAMWSRADPVTLFGAATTVQGWEEISPVFSWLGEAFTDLQAYRMEVLAAGVSGDLAYLVALEHVTCSMNGAPPQPYTLRATTVFRREAGQWLAVHRHGDPLAAPSGGPPGGR